MLKWLCLGYVFLFACSSSKIEAENQWEVQAANVTITRDIYGVAHISGKTDADAVFGMMYAQCEENFEKVEESYLRILGRMAEKEGEAYYYQDLSMKIMYDTSAAKRDYQNAPPGLKKLLTAFSDGIHYFLFKNPAIKPAVLTRFEPWYPLLFSDGAYISANTGGLDQTDMQNLFKKNSSQSPPVSPNNKEPAGSNAFALSPSASSSGKAILFINPHVSFYFRTEIHMISDEGLNAYGAATWGQFFIYQGFNNVLGWMHTSSLADAADLYEENISIQNGKYYYEYEKKLKPAKEKDVVISYRKEGNLYKDSLKIQLTEHGPIMGLRNGKHLSLKSVNHSQNALIQSWQRMKAKDMNEFTQILSLRTNNSTNTMYADNKGNIAYWHGNFVPRRNASFNWALPVDGTVAATEWNGLHEINELVHVINPKNGWVQNCNSSPFFVAANNSPVKTNYPSYMAPEAENFRSRRAISQFSSIKKWTADELAAMSFDGHLSMFESLLPPLLEAYSQLPDTDPLKKNLEEPIQVLHSWNKKSSANSVATTVAVFWASNMLSQANQKTEQQLDNMELVNYANQILTGREKLEILSGIVNGLSRYYGNWKMPWGEINRFQRTKDSDRNFDDTKESMAVPYASAIFGCLASYETMWGKDKKQYGVAGNSFIAIVEFGDRIRARSLTTGGQSFDPDSKHFNDQAQMFTEGKMKEVFFYKDDIEKNAERTYRPGNEK